MPPRPTLRDLLVAGAFVAWSMIEVAVGAVNGPVAVNMSAALLATVALAWRRRAPIACALVCAGGLVLKTALGLPLDGLALLGALLVAAYTLGRNESPVRVALTGAAMIVLAWLSLFGLPTPDRTASNYPFVALWVGAPTVAGAALRAEVSKAERMADRAARAEMYREEHAQVAVQSERGRIAREMHDTVAHAVSVMVLHAGAVRSRLPAELDSERLALAQVEDTGRQAIAELRRLLGILRSDSGLSGTEPQPTLAQLDRLIDDARSHGLVIELDVDDDLHPLEPAVEVSAYRILQEALTNVRKHAEATTVWVRVGYEGGWLRLRIADDGVGAISNTNGRSDTGYGLVGIRERVEVYGGTLSLSSPTGGGFVVDAALPVR
jgi:signal transduction histidine kinase